MTLQLDFDIAGSVAFEEDPETETARVLRDIARDVENGYDGGSVKDPNGNSVGSWFLRSDDEEDED